MHFDQMSRAEITRYYGDISSSKYEISSMRDVKKLQPAPPIESILTLNKDVEPYVIQAAGGRLGWYRDKYKPLQFVHFSDIHARMELWNRMVEYVNCYSDNISFALHTGDYCGAAHHVYRDFYTYGTACKRPVMNCVGNHDTYLDISRAAATKAQIHEKLFPYTENWDATFMEGEASLNYYKDFPDSGIRLIVLDLYHDIEQQCDWLKGLLADAKEQQLSVITAMHELTAEIIEPAPVNFHSILRETGTPENAVEPMRESPFEDILADFVDDGGKHICNLAGHFHHDLFGYTKRGLLNIVVECATDFASHTDGRRTRGTKCYDCFNVISLDVNIGLLRIVRVGNPADMFLRSKKVLCYDYINRKVISNF